MSCLKYSSFILLLFSFLYQNTFGQNYNNEWIDFEQTYLKIKVAKSGLYRIPFSSLQNTDFPLTADGFQIYNKGNQVPIYLTTNGTLSNEDYIEFYAEKNDGKLYKDVFSDAAFQLSDVKSLFSDTAAYFLSWDNTDFNLRINQINNNLSVLPQAETHFNHRIDVVPNNQFFAGQGTTLADGQRLHFSDFENGEGFVGIVILEGNTKNYTLKTGEIYRENPDITTATMSLKVVGQNDNLALDNEHHVAVAINDVPQNSFEYDGFGNYTKDFEVDLDILNDTETIINVSSLADVAGTNRNSVAAVSIDYQRTFNFENLNSIVFSLENSTEKYLEITNFDAGTTPLLIDLTNRLRIEPTIEGNTLRIRLPQGLDTTAKRHLLLQNTTIPSAISLVNEFENVSFNDFSLTENEGDFLIITHQSLRQGANDFVQDYADFRASELGGNHSVQIIDIAELYNQFAFGINPHPISIRNFINFAIDKWEIQPNHVLLLGKAVTYADITYNSGNFSGNLVPTYGHTPSDNMLACRHANTYQPQVAIGRVPAEFPQQVQAYLEKLTQYTASYVGTDCAENNFWRKHFLQLTQSDSEEESANVTANFAAYEATLSGAGLGGKSLGLYQNNFVAALPNSNIGQAIVDGAGWIIYTGSSNNNGYWNTDVASPLAYDNAGKYPFVLSNANISGQIHQVPNVSECIASDYVLANQSGAIAFLANSGEFFEETANAYTTAFIENVTQQNYGESLGFCVAKNIENLYDETENETPNLTKYILQTKTLVGDPAIHIVPRPKVELTFLSNDNITFYNPNTGFEIISDPIYVSSEMPHFETELVLHNAGRAVQDSIFFAAQRLLPNGTLSTVTRKRIAVPFYSDTVRINVPNNIPTENGQELATFIFLADEFFDNDETCYNNNTLSQVANIKAFCGTFLPETIPLNSNSDLPIEIDAYIPNYNYFNYEWTTGDTTATIEVQTLGDYTVLITDNYDCEIVHTISVELANGISSPELLEKIAIHPNPTANFLHIAGAEKTSMKLYDMQGNLFLEKKQTPEMIDMSDFAKGIYLLVLIEDEKVAAFKVMR